MNDLDVADGDEPLYVPEDFMLGRRMPERPPVGYYKVTLFGRHGEALYMAHYPPYQCFQYMCPSHFDGMQVYGVSIEWEEA